MTEEGGTIAFDDSAWPLLVGTCPARLSDSSVRSLIAFFDGVHAKKERFALVLDTRPLGTMPGARWRKEIADWGGSPKVQGHSMRYCVATAVVTSSVLTRGVFVALGWLWKPAAPVRAVATVEEAAVWCGDLMARGGVLLSPKARALLDSLARGGQRPASRVGR
jgi:hypothetical protein